jgi:hypothetical protein
LARLPVRLYIAGSLLEDVINFACAAEITFSLKKKACGAETI